MKLLNAEHTAYAIININKSCGAYRLLVKSSSPKQRTKTRNRFTFKDLKLFDTVFGDVSESFIMVSANIRAINTYGVKNSRQEDIEYFDRNHVRCQVL